MQLNIVIRHIKRFASAPMVSRQERTHGGMSSRAGI